MSRLLNLYRTQFRIMREWRGGTWSLVKRLIIVTLVAAVSFVLTTWIMPGLPQATLVVAVQAIVVMAVFNALIRPAVLAFVAPRSLVLTGVSVLLLQILVFSIAIRIVPGIDTQGLLTPLIGSFVYVILNTILTSIFAIDSGDSFYGLLIQQLMIKRAAPKPDKPGLVIIQIDGLAHPILAARVRGGSVNAMPRWVQSGSHRLAATGEQGQARG